MCGISGVFRIGPVIHDPDSDLNLELQSECNILNSYNGLRGPDHSNLLHFPNCALGHTRLSIRDLSNRSNQPVLTDNGFAFSFNGEIYAHSDPSLPPLSLFDSDTLWLKRTIETAGLPDFRLIYGDFAFAFYNRIDHKLVLVRDHFGKKPLYYSLHNNKLSFSSSLPGLAHILPSTTINQLSLSEYLIYGNSFSNRCIYNEIRLVPPGCLVSVDLFSGNVSTSNYYTYSPFEPTGGAYTYKSRKQALEDFHLLLSSVVESHLVSDVTISSLLSGGIDSKSITYCASQYSSINAYTARFVGASSEDLQAASFSSLYPNINHTSVSVSSDNLISTIRDFSCFVGEPFADASVFSLIPLYKSLPSSNRVVLQGDGGDELFGGYSRYKRFPFYSRIPSLIPRLFLSLFPGLHPRLLRLLNLSSSQEGGLYAQLMTMDIPQSCLLPLFSSLQDFSFFDVLESLSADFPVSTSSPSDSKLSLMDFSHQLSSQFLYKVDRASMFVSKEARIPFIDSRITDFLSCIPPSVRFRRSPEKSFLRNSLPIPTSQSFTPKKGFSTPYHLWIRDHFETINDYLYSDRFLSTFGIDHVKLGRFLGDRSDKHLYSFQVWKLFNLSVWFHHVFI